MQPGQRTPKKRDSATTLKRNQAYCRSLKLCLGTMLDKARDPTTKIETLLYDGTLLCQLLQILHNNDAHLKVPGVTRLEIKYTKKIKRPSQAGDNVALFLRHLADLGFDRQLMFEPTQLIEPDRHNIVRVVKCLFSLFDFAVKRWSWKAPVPEVPTLATASALTFSQTELDEGNAAIEKDEQSESRTDPGLPPVSPSAPESPAAPTPVSPVPLAAGPSTTTPAATTTATPVAEPKQDEPAPAAAATSPVSQAEPKQGEPTPAVDSLASPAPVVEPKQNEPSPLPASLCEEPVKESSTASSSVAAEPPKVETTSDGAATEAAPTEMKPIEVAAADDKKPAEGTPEVAQDGTLDDPNKPIIDLTPFYRIRDSLQELAASIRSKEFTPVDACPECSILRKELEAARQERDRARQEADQWRSKLLEYLKAPAEAAAELAQSSIAPTTVNPL